MQGKLSWTTRCENPDRNGLASSGLVLAGLLCCVGTCWAAGTPVAPPAPAALTLPDHLGVPSAAWASRSRALMGSAVNWRMHNGLELWTPSVLAVPGTHTTLDGRIYLRLKGHRSMLGVSYAF